MALSKALRSLRSGKEPDKGPEGARENYFLGTISHFVNLLACPDSPRIHDSPGDSARTRLRIERTSSGRGL